MKSSTIGLLSLFSAAFIYGSQSIGTRALGTFYSPFLVTGLRSLMVVLLLVWFVKWKKVASVDWKWILFRSGGNVLSTVCLFIAINQMSVGVSLFLFYAGMIISGTLFGIVFYKEKMSPVKIFSMLLTVIGLMTIYLSQTTLNISFYMLVAFVGGVGASLWSVFSRPISHRYALPQLVVTDHIVSGLLAFLISLSIGESWGASFFHPKMLAVAYLGLTQVFTGQLVATGFRYVDAQIASVILLNDTIIGMLLTYGIFGETVPFIVIVGGACIVLSSVIPAVITYRTHSKAHL